MFIIFSQKKENKKKQETMRQSGTQKNKASAENEWKKKPNKETNGRNESNKQEKNVHLCERGKKGAV